MIVFLFFYFCVCVCVCLPLCVCVCVCVCLCVCVDGWVGVCVCGICTSLLVFVSMYVFCVAFILVAFVVTFLACFIKTTMLMTSFKQNDTFNTPLLSPQKSLEKRRTFAEHSFFIKLNLFHL